MEQAIVGTIIRRDHDHNLTIRKYPRLKQITLHVKPVMDLSFLLEAKHLHTVRLVFHGTGDDIDLDTKKDGDPWNISSLAKHPKLKELEIDTYDGSLDDVWISFSSRSSNNSKLASLELTCKNPCSPHLPEGLLLEHLTILVIAPSGHSGDLSSFLKMCPNLQSLELDGCSLSDLSLLTETLFLTSLRIYRCHVESLGGIEFCNFLEHIVFYRTTGIEYLSSSEGLVKDVRLEHSIKDIRPEYRDLFPPSVKIEFIF